MNVPVWQRKDRKVESTKHTDKDELLILLSCSLLHYIQKDTLAQHP